MMTHEQAFSMATNGSLLGWLLLALAPRWRWTARLVPSLGVGALALAYSCLAIPGLLGSLSGHGAVDGDFTSLRAVRELFANDSMLLAGWIHYLAFDLFVGSWITADSLRRSISRWILVPCLALTLFAGPVGLLSYLIVRLGSKQPEPGAGWLLTHQAEDHDTP